MRRLCILCDDENVEKARERVKTFLNADVLNIPVSGTGNFPATHWFCHLQSTEDGYAKFMEMQKYTIIEEGGPKNFLSKRNLKVIRNDERKKS